MIMYDGDDDVVIIIIIKDIGAPGSKGILNTLLESRGVPVKLFLEPTVAAVVDYKVIIIIATIPYHRAIGREGGKEGSKEGVPIMMIISYHIITCRPVGLVGPVAEVGPGYP